MLKDNQDSPHHPSHSDLHSSKTFSEEVPMYNILLLGATQSGKSTLLEFIKKYADPSYDIDRSHIGYGNESHTKGVRVEVVSTTLPVYKLYDRKDGNREFDTSRLKDERSFKKFLARDDDLELRPEEVPGSTKVRFRIFDTPGLNDTTMEDDITNIAKIFPALSKIDNFHLIVVMDSHHVPLFPSQKSAFTTCFDLFEDFKSLMMVVHTKSPNHHRFPGLNKFFDTKLSQRSEFFNRIAGRDVPTKRIDCDLEETGPAHLCMTRNAIREILEIATIKPPVAKKMALVRKMPTMIAVDRKLHKICDRELEFTLQLCQTESGKLKMDIKLTEWEIEKKKKLLREHDTDDLLLLSEKRFDEGGGPINWIKDRFGGQADQEHTMELLEQDHTIDNLTVAHQEIEVLDQKGGRGETSWSVRFKRHAFKPGYYHVVLSTYKRTKFRKEVGQWKWELDQWNKALKRSKEERDALNEVVENKAIESPEKSFTSRPYDLCNKAVGYRKILDFTEAETLSLDLFLRLVDAGVYQGGDIDLQVQALEEQLTKEFGVCV